MKERIWYELCQIKFNCCYSNLLIGKYIKLSSYINITILIFSSAGVMGWKIWDNFPWIACIIISLISLLKLIAPHVVPSEKELEKLQEISGFYTNFFNKLEQLWFDYFNRRIDDKEAQKRFYKLKESEEKINRTVNSIIKGQNKDCFKKAENETREYLTLTFNTHGNNDRKKHGTSGKER